MTIQEIEKYAKTIGLWGDYSDTMIGCLYMSFGEPHKSTVLYYPGDENPQKIFISKTLKWRKTAFGDVRFETDDFPKDKKFHGMTEYPSYLLSDTNGIITALNNLGAAYKRCLIEIKKAEIKKDFEDVK
jgi:hypothetical protein